MSRVTVRTSTPCWSRSSSAFASRGPCRARHQDEVHAARGDRRGPRAPDAFGSAGDECPRTVASGEVRRPEHAVRSFDHANPLRRLDVSDSTGADHDRTRYSRVGLCVRLWSATRVMSLDEPIAGPPAVCEDGQRSDNCLGNVNLRGKALLMKLDDMILVSIDDHVIEPADMFERHVPAKYADRAPRIVVTDDGVEQWEFDGITAGTMGLNAVVGWPKEEWGLDPVSFAEMRPGAYDVHQRVRDMNRNGILASMCFPTFAGFNGGNLQRADRELASAIVAAYNDWHIDEWAAAYPDRFIPLAIAPVWDPRALVAEMQRVAAKGCKAVTMPELPYIQGLPSYHDLDYWHPFFETVSDLGIVMCLHIGQGLGAITSAPDAPIDNLIVLANQVSVLAAQDLLWGPALRSYPDLKLAWSEAGIGWIPFFLERCDRHYTNQRWLGHDFGGKLPSDVFRDHSLACFVTDRSGLKLRNEIGIDNIAWESDYPHSDGLWPDAPELVFAELQDAGCTDEEINQITWQNTCRFFDFDPFTRLSPEGSTVGALRALSPDVDTTTHTRQEWRAINATASVTSS